MIETEGEFKARKAREADDRATSVRNELEGLLNRTPRGAATWDIRRCNEFKNTVTACRRVAARPKAGQQELTEALGLLRRFHN